MKRKNIRTWTDVTLTSVPSERLGLKPLSIQKDITDKGAIRRPCCGWTKFNFRLWKQRCKHMMNNKRINYVTFVHFVLQIVIDWWKFHPYACTMLLRLIQRSWTLAPIWEPYVVDRSGRISIFEDSTFSGNDWWLTAMTAREAILWIRNFLTPRVCNNKSDDAMIHRSTRKKIKISPKTQSVCLAPVAGDWMALNKLSCFNMWSGHFAKRISCSRKLGWSRYLEARSNEPVWNFDYWKNSMEKLKQDLRTSAFIALKTVSGAVVKSWNFF